MSGMMNDAVDGFVCYDWLRGRGYDIIWTVLNLARWLCICCIAKICYMGYRVGFWCWANGFTYTEVRRMKFNTPCIPT
jgi:hypothetical protein